MQHPEETKSPQKRDPGGRPIAPVPEATRNPLAKMAGLSGVRRLIRLRVGGSIFQTVLDLFYALMLMNILDVMISADKQGTGKSLVLFAASMAGMGLFTGLNAWLSGLIIARSGAALRARVVGRYASLGFDRATAKSGPSVQTLITTALRPVQDYLGRDLPAMFHYGSKFVMTVALLGFMNWKLMVASVLIIPLFVWLSGKTGDPLEARMSELVEEQSHVNDQLSELQAGLPVIKAFRIAGRMLQRFQLALDAYFRTSLEVERKRALLQFFEIFLNYAPFIASFLLGGWYAVQGTLTAGGLLAFVQLVGYIAEPSAMFPTLLARRKMAAGASGSVSDFLSLPIEPDREMNPTGPDMHGSASVVHEPADLLKIGNPSAREPAVPDMETAILLEEVGFSWGEQSILQSINLSIPLGSVTALVGSSGSGKTTLLHLLAGLLEPRQGRISFPALHPGQTHMTGRERRQSISLVTQQPVLFPWSIRKNVSCGNPEADHERIGESLRLAGVEPFLFDAENGLDTLLTEGGKGLSGGQSQRITIARALLKDAPVLLMDEPTSALDRMAEDGIVALMENLRGRTTIVLTAHRLSTIRLADRIVLLQDGCVAGVGTHQTLYASHSEYRKLCEELDRPDESGAWDTGEALA